MSAFDRFRAAEESAKPVGVGRFSSIGFFGSVSELLLGVNWLSLAVAISCSQERKARRRKAGP